MGKMIRTFYIIKYSNIIELLINETLVSKYFTKIYNILRLKSFGLILIITLTKKNFFNLLMNLLLRVDKTLLYEEFFYFYGKCNFL